MIELIVVPGAIPEPLTTIPGTSPAVLDTVTPVVPLVVTIPGTAPVPLNIVTDVPLTLPTTAPKGMPAPLIDIPGTIPAASAALANVIVLLPNVRDPTAVRPVFGVIPKYALPEPVAVAACESVTVFPSTTDKLAPFAVGADDKVSVLPSTMDAIVAPAGIPAPVTKVPAVKPSVETPETVVLPEVTVAVRVSPKDASVVPNGIPGP